MNFFKQAFSDKLDRASHKRLMSGIAFVVFIQAVEMNLFHGAKLDTQLLVMLMTIVFGLSGAATIESMATKNPDSSKKTTLTTTTDKTETTNT